MTSQANKTPCTYIATEQGNGLPGEGDLVLLPDDHGWHRLLRVVSTGGIQTRQWEANSMLVQCVDADQSWDDLREVEQDRLYASLHHVGSVDADDERAD